MLPSNHLFDTIESERKAATAHGVQHGMWELEKCSGWDSVVASCEEHVKLLMLSLSTSADRHWEIRGKIAAYRDIIAFPQQVIDKATIVISNETGV